MPSTETRTVRVFRLEPRLAGPRIGVSCGTGYEALLGLIMFAGHQPPGDYDIGQEWFDRVRSRASRQLHEDVARLCAGVPTVFGHLLGLVRLAREPRDLASLVDLVAELAPRRLRLELLGGSVSTVQAGVAPTVLERAADGDRVATQELLAVAADDEHWARNVRAVLALTPEETSGLTVRVLRRWADEVFTEQEAQLAQRLTAQADRWRTAATRTGWREVVEDATGGIVLGEDLPADSVLLVPTVLGAPWVYSTDVNGTRVFCCPVREQSGPTAETLVPVLRALGDPTRLTVLRHLATTGPTTLSELTAKLGISKSAVHKHVMLLRSAGLIRVELGRDRRYALRDLPDLTALVTRVIHAGP
ncbi:winged helix-turn-helix domain-containing protein [Streptomyces sp. NPDC086519]|uniref:ArsR/SmtB family transcription factor n=1 Tax=Streptomyces sp. NPDC086519 TaxID=3154863 RepID=UPI00343AFF4E